MNKNTFSKFLWPQFGLWESFCIYKQAKGKGELEFHNFRGMFFFVANFVVLWIWCESFLWKRDFFEILKVSSKIETLNLILLCVVCLFGQWQWWGVGELELIILLCSKVSYLFSIFYNYSTIIYPIKIIKPFKKKFIIIKLIIITSHEGGGVALYFISLGWWLASFSICHLSINIDLI